MTQRHSNQGLRSGARKEPANRPQDHGQGESFDPSGPYGGFGGAGGSQGSVYGVEPASSGGRPSQRQEHEAWQKAQDPAGLHGGVLPGAQDSSGDDGEVQGHHGGFWYGGGKDAHRARQAPAQGGDAKAAAEKRGK